jgi:repressor LexA
MKPLSAVQQKVFNKLRDYQRRNGQLPDLSAFARELGMHYVSLKQHLEALAKKGYLSFEGKGRGRSPHIALPAQVVGIPVMGHIPAGPLSEAFADAESFLPIPGIYDHHFALRVKGDSMADLIQNGDVVLFKQQNQPDRNGQICAVRIEESETTLKYLDKLEPNKYLLRPHNPLYPTLEVHARDVKIDGVYLGLLRGELAWALLSEREIN